MPGKTGLLAGGREDSKLHLSLHHCFCLLLTHVSLHPTRQGNYVAHLLLQACLSLLVILICWCPAGQLIPVLLPLDSLHLHWVILLESSECSHCTVSVQHHLGSSVLGARPRPLYLS